MQFDLPFLHHIFIGFISLFPVVDPIGSAFIVDPLLSGLDLQQRKKAAKAIAFYCFAICLANAFIGSWFLRLFGISIPVVQLAGGIMICHMGWLLLIDDDVKGKKETAQPTNRDNILFYPVAFPMTTGAGTISVILTLSAHENDKDLSYAPFLIHRIGARGEGIVNRISAFLVFCIGMQIAWSGIRALIKTL